ncbi:MAG: hypothetical protein OHK0040_05050 [bacterium]
MKMNFSELPEFTKEFRQLAKKYKSLPEDLEEFKSVIAVNPSGNSKHFNVITNSETMIILKARFFCRYLKGSSMRIIYTFDRQKNKVEFIEVYFKGVKEKEDFERIKKYLKNKS